MAIKRQEKDRNKKKEKEYIRLFTEDIETVLDQKKGLSKIISHTQLIKSIGIRTVIIILQMNRFSL